MKNKEAKWVQDNITKIKVLDVREVEEHSEWSLKGTFNVPMNVLMIKPQDYIMNKDEVVYIHCNSGGRSARTIQTLEKQGYTNLINVTGGIKAMDKDGLLGTGGKASDFHCQAN